MIKDIDPKQVSKADMQKSKDGWDTWFENR